MKDFWQTRKIYPTITTTTGSDWRGKIEELKDLKLTEAALFPTPLKSKERQELYNLLEKTPLKHVPFVHLRTDMDGDEVEYFIKRWGTRIFNVHPFLFDPLPATLKKFKDLIYIENNSVIWSESDVNQVAGLCVDFSHLEDTRRTNKGFYMSDLAMLETHLAGCAHISAISAEPYSNQETNKIQYSKHYLDNLSEVDYLLGYPAKYFPPVIAIELENSLKEQLEIKEYIVKLLK
ncbi:MAG: hypothetical protein AAB673_01455 [Patescibacteria group bacterium]